MKQKSRFFQQTEKKNHFSNMELFDFLRWHLPHIFKCLTRLELNKDFEKSFIEFVPINQNNTQVTGEGALQL